MFLFLHDLTWQAWASWLTGLVFTLAPYHLTRILAQSHLGSIHWWPWYTWALHRLLAKGRWAFVMLAGCFAALTLWSGLLPGMYSLAVGLYDVATGERPSVTAADNSPLPNGYFVLPDSLLVAGG